MSRILRFAQIYHQRVTTCEDDLAATSAADALAMLTDHLYVAKTTGDDAEALTLANGKPGQMIVINHVVTGGGTGTLTPVTATGWNTIAFADAGDQAVLFYVDDIVGWILLSTFGLTNQPTVT